MEKVPLMGTETCFQPVKSNLVMAFCRLEVVPSLYRKESVLPEPSPRTQRSGWSAGADDCGGGGAPLGSIAAGFRQGVVHLGAPRPSFT